MFLIYRNDLHEGLSTYAKLFADDTSLFFIIHDFWQTFGNDLNKDLKMIRDWGFQWKMTINPNPTKQAQEAIFS